jgi:DNA-directed RNA polymerase, sigma subunit (sigma70/sigma32)
MVEIAHAQQDRLTKEEIRKYLDGQELTEKNMQAVYHYLGENRIVVEGYDFVPEPATRAAGHMDKKEKMAAGKETRREANMRLYHQEVERLSGDLGKEEAMLLSFLKGDFSLKNVIIEKYLHKVVEFAQRYKKRKVPLDEVIAEGNLGVMAAMQIIMENHEEYILPGEVVDIAKFFGTLEMETIHAMECYIDGMTDSKDWENTMLAKTNLLHEAVKYMTEEMGRMPTLEELSEYTKISEREIKEISGLSKEVKKNILGEN